MLDALSDLERKQIANVHCEMDSSSATIVNDDGTGEETIQAHIKCDNQKTTCFVEAETMVTSHFKSEKMFTDIKDTLQDIRDFLGKPYLINQVHWDASIATNASIMSIPATPTDGIGSFLTTVTQWEFKRRGFELARGTFVLRLEINANPFQAGSAIIHYLPNYKDRTAIEPLYPKRYNKHLIQKFQHPYVRFEVKDTCVIFKVPYIAPTPWYDIKNSEWDWGSIFVDCVAPFKTGASGNSYAEVSAFIYWEDIQLAAPIVPQADNTTTVRRRTDREHIEYNTNKPVSSGLKLVSQAASDLGSIPMLSKVASTVSWAADVSSGIASIFGWSKPRLNEAPTIVYAQGTRYHGTSDGPDGAIPTALISDNQLKLTTSYSLTDEDEMSLKYLLSIPTYMGIVNWPVATASSDTPLYTLLVQPRILRSQQTDVVGLYTTTYSCAAPLSYMSNFFKYWRGSIKLTINVVKTIYHSGKLLVTWTPYKAASVVAPTRATSVYSLRQIMDIREQSTITLNLPYLVNRPYLDNLSDYSGTVDIFILNELRAPETAAQSVDLEFYYTAGDDFEYQVPGPMVEMSNYGPYTPQMDNTTLIVNMGIADTPVEHLDTGFSTMSIGEHFASLKQLVNRYVPIIFVSAQALGAKYLAIYPWYLCGSRVTAVTGVLTTGSATGDVLSFFAPMYNYMRGGARFYANFNASVVGVANIPNAFKDISAPTNFFDVGTQYTAGYAGNAGYGAAVPGAVTGASANGINPVITGQFSSVAHEHIPFQSKFPVTIPYIWNTTSHTVFTTANDWVPSGVATFGAAAAATLSTPGIITRSFADDFQLSFFIGCPPLLYSHALT